MQKLLKTDAGVSPQPVYLLRQVIMSGFTNLSDRHILLNTLYLWAVQ